MAKNNGGPAFPEKKPRYVAGYATNEFDPVSGMSLRDYLAAKALQAICTHNDTWGLGLEEIGPKAYAIADLMLRAREQ